MVLGNSVKKKAFNRYFPSYVKFSLSILIMHILFSRTNQKTCYRKNERLNLESLFVNWGSQFLIPLIKSLKMTCD